MFIYFIVGHSRALICTYICIFHSLFLQLENDPREIETSFFIASFYSEMFFEKTAQKLYTRERRQLLGKNFTYVLLKF